MKGRALYTSSVYHGVVPGEYIGWVLNATHELADGNWADAEELCKRTTLKNQKNFLFALYTQQVRVAGPEYIATLTPTAHLVYSASYTA